MSQRIASFVVVLALISGCGNGGDSTPTSTDASSSDGSSTDAAGDSTGDAPRDSTADSRDADADDTARSDTALDTTTSVTDSMDASGEAEAETGCGAGTHLCGATCADDTSIATCGASCTPCPSTGPHVAGATCAAGSCGLACTRGWADADRDPADGCEKASCALDGATGRVAWWTFDTSTDDEFGRYSMVFAYDASAGEVAGADHLASTHLTAKVGTPLGTERTLELWVQLSSSVPTTGADVVVAGSPSIVGRYFAIHLSPSALSVTNGSDSVVGPAIVPSGWHHVAATAVHGGAVSLYLDGALVGSSTTFALSTSLQPMLQLGDGAFDGSVDEVVLWDRALSASEIAEIYAAGATGECTGGCLGEFTGAAGACTCAPGPELQTDSANCGACGVACVASSQCVEGTCIAFGGAREGNATTYIVDDPLYGMGGLVDFHVMAPGPSGPEGGGLEFYLAQAPSPDFGGAYLLYGKTCSSAFDTSMYNFTTGTYACATGTTALHFSALAPCDGSSVTSDYVLCAGATAGPTFFGAFQVDDPGGRGCRVSNPFTGACTCPAGSSPEDLRVYVGDVAGSPAFPSHLEICIPSS